MISRAAARRARTASEQTTPLAGGTPRRASLCLNARRGAAPRLAAQRGAARSSGIEASAPRAAPVRQRRVARVPGRQEVALVRRAVALAPRLVPSRAEVREQEKAKVESSLLSYVRRGEYIVRFE